MELENHPIIWSHGIAVVIPSYRVVHHILEVVNAFGPEVDVIYCVDDACPEGSGDFIACNASDPRIRVLRHAQNLGVGGAVMTGYRQAIADGARVIVKVDGDGQMNPTLIPAFVTPILRGIADYTKGNRFWDLRQIKQMPFMRRIGNLGLSFLAKASTGYWNVFDPTNGYTAIHADIAARLPLDSISKRYFFETDMLFRLNTLRAVVLDVPMDARYGDETSSLKASRVLVEFSGIEAHGIVRGHAALPAVALEIVCDRTDHVGGAARQVDAAVAIVVHRPASQAARHELRHAHRAGVAAQRLERIGARLALQHQESFQLAGEIGAALRGPRV